MKNIEKNSSIKVNNNNNEVLSPEVIKAQLKAACQDMNAKETKDYIKSLDGYELRLTGKKPTQHYTVFYGEVRVCNVEQVQGIKADGTSRGCTSTPAIKTFCDAVSKVHESNYKKIGEELTTEESEKTSDKIAKAVLLLSEVDKIFAAANERAAERAKAAAKAAAKAKREAAAKKRAQNKMNNKLKESSDNEKIAALAAVLDISFDEAKIIFEKKRAQKTA